MKYATLQEIVAAAHLSYLVERRTTGESHGGLMFVAPPGHLKTTAIEVMRKFPGAKVISNLTVSSLIGLRQGMLTGDIHTLAFSDYEMLYKRQGAFSNQMEGTLMSMIAEGFRVPGFKDQTITTAPARCTILGGITTDFHERMWGSWAQNGFARRFLWAHYRLANPEKLEEALTHYRYHPMDDKFVTKIPMKEVPYVLSQKQAAHMLYQMRNQPDRKLPFILAQRIVCVLIWKFGVRAAFKLWDDFAESLMSDCMVKL